MIARRASQVISVAIAFLAMILCISSPCSATIVLPTSPEFLARQAAFVFAGTVSAMRSERIEGTIITKVTFTNLKSGKGSGPRDSVTIALRGGTIGNDFITIDGQPHFDLKKRYILFVLKDLGSPANSYLPILGLYQGCFKVLPGGTAATPDTVVDMSGRPVVRMSRQRITVVSNESNLDARQGGRIHGSAKAESLLAIKRRPLPDGVPEVLPHGSDPGARLTESDFLGIVRQFAK